MHGGFKLMRENKSYKSTDVFLHIQQKNRFWVNWSQESWQNGFLARLVLSLILNDFQPGSEYELIFLNDLFYMYKRGSHVVIAWGVAVAVTNLTNSSDTLCTDEDSACQFACSKHDNRSAIFCSPGKYLTWNLYGCYHRIHLSIRAHGLDLLE